jgi:hypothetical protein
MKAAVLDGMQPGPCEQIMVGPSSVIPDPAPLQPCSFPARIVGARQAPWAGRRAR